jgi:hypothetical protein
LAAAAAEVMCQLTAVAVEMLLRWLRDLTLGLLHLLLLLLVLVLMP